VCPESAPGYSRLIFLNGRRSQSPSGTEEVKMDM
jgi:hypothetical protein